ncbi:hypothetical protein NA56DRAFT_334799 [Hyaloscypha hepaticicola]|uniref:Uncharacterized protein n=1 Tax=Hyaloscypha hepaticicola TaxID=2082293 RepID=A0A2J6QIG9_9HELO|nr:hypothetical protein NA56DRAFT_334799 [Hyaloscypha hepaticicola]
MIKSNSDTREGRFVNVRDCKRHNRPNPSKTHSKRLVLRRKGMQHKHQPTANNGNQQITDNCASQANRATLHVIITAKSYISDPVPPGAFIASFHLASRIRFRLISNSFFLSRNFIEDPWQTMNEQMGMVMFSSSIVVVANSLPLSPGNVPRHY